MQEELQRAEAARSVRAAQVRQICMHTVCVLECSSMTCLQLAALEEEVLLAVEAAVQEKVAILAGSEEMQRRVMSRLREERAKLEAAVTAQLEEEKAALLHKKRREQVCPYSTCSAVGCHLRVWG